MFKCLSDEFMADCGVLAEQAPQELKHEANRLYLLAERIWAAADMGVTDLYQHYLLMEKSLTPKPAQKALVIPIVKKKKWQRSKAKSLV